MNMRKRKSNQQPLKEVFDDLIKIYGWDDQYTAAKISSIFSELMGKAVMNQTKSVRFSKGILYLNLTSSVLKNEFSYSKDKIKKLLNDELKSDIIKEVKVY